MPRNDELPKITRLPADSVQRAIWTGTFPTKEIYNPEIITYQTRLDRAGTTAFLRGLAPSAKSPPGIESKPDRYRFIT